MVTKANIALLLKRLNFDKRKFFTRTRACTGIITTWIQFCVLATRETSYIYASTSAAIMHTISRGCMSGKLSRHCACSEEGRPESLHKNHIWGGCGDNLPYGYQFSKLFTDAGEQLTSDTLSSFARVLMNLHNNEAGRWVSVFVCFFLFMISWSL